MRLHWIPHDEKGFQDMRWNKPVWRAWTRAYPEQLALFVQCRHHQGLRAVRSGAAGLGLSVQAQSHKRLFGEIPGHAVVGRLVAAAPDLLFVANILLPLGRHLLFSLVTFFFSFFFFFSFLFSFYLAGADKPAVVPTTSRLWRPRDGKGLGVVGWLHSAQTSASSHPSDT